MCAPSNLAGDQPVTSTRESELRAANSLAACSPYGLHTHYQSEGIALNCTRMASSRWQAVPHCMAHSFAPFENKATSSRRSWTSKHPSKRRDLAAPEGQLVQSLRYDSPICQVATCRAHCSKACINPVQGQLAECCSERTPFDRKRAPSVQAKSTRAQTAGASSWQFGPGGSGCTRPEGPRSSRRMRCSRSRSLGWACLRRTGGPDASP